MIASLLAVTNPGDEVVIFEPYYENYGPDTLLCGAERKFVRLHPEPRLALRSGRIAPGVFSAHQGDHPQLARQSHRARCSTAQQLEYIAPLCQEFDALAITDEIYEHILYDGAGTSR